MLKVRGRRIIVSMHGRELTSYPITIAFNINNADEFRTHSYMLSPLDLFIILLLSIHCLWKGISAKGMFGVERERKEKKNRKKKIQKNFAKK